jgi:hypothetical protein
MGYSSSAKIKPATRAGFAIGSPMLAPTMWVERPSQKHWFNAALLFILNDESNYEYVWMCKTELRKSG